MGKINWTPDKEKYLRDNYPTVDTYELAEHFECSYKAITSRAKKLKIRKQSGIMNLPLNSIWRRVDINEFKQLFPTISNSELGIRYGISYRKVKNHAKRLGLKKDSKHQNTGQFKKGHIPWIAGTKGMTGANSHSFPKGHKPKNALHDGAITVRKDNRGLPYQFIRISEGNWLHMHVHTWVQHNGPVPGGMLVTFIDGDTMNCDINNLDLISMKENALRNSGSIHLPDGYVAHLIAGKHYKHLKDEILENKDLIELKRQNIILNRKINERIKPKNSKSTG